MAYKLRLAVVLLLLGTSFSCFSRPTNRGMRNRNRTSQMEKLPLESLLTQAQNAKAQNNPKLERKIYKIICKVHKGRIEAADAYFFLGVYYEENHQFSTAVKKFTKIMERYAESSWFSQAVEYCFQIGEKLQKGVRPRYFGVVPGFRDSDSAIKAYELVLKHAPFSHLAPEALKQIAELQVLAKRHDLAIDALDRIIDLYPNSVEIPYAYLKIAEIYKNSVKGVEYNQGGAIIALRYYQDFITIFPQNPEVDPVKKIIRELEESIVKSKISLGDFYFDVCRNREAAKKSYCLAIDVAPYTSAASTAQSRIIEINEGKKPKSTPVDFLFPHRDQKNDCVDPVNQKSVTPLIQSEDVPAPDKTNEA
jgi:outer membrane protein assembly factor BamD